MAWLRVTGDDARIFLQGQFTQDLKVVSLGGAAYGLWLNQKGKVLADSVVLSAGANELFLWSEASSEASIRERLDAYIIADDVVLEPLASMWEQLIIAGEGATEWVSARLGGVLPEVGRFARAEGGFVFRGRHGELDSWMWLSPAGQGPDVSGFPTLDDNVFALARISAGIPLIPTEIGPDDLPNEARLDEVAISYTKGCYLGQEVMARLKSMGRVRRRLVRVSSQAGATGPRAKLWQGDKAVGELRAVASCPNGGYVGLAMLNLFNLDATAGLALGPSAAAVWSLEETI